MNHEMKLSNSAFEGIKSGKQKFETRLFDEKRQKILVGDTITFSKRPELFQTVKAKVTKIITAKDFEKLFSKFDTKEANWPSDFSPKDCVNAMAKYYSIVKQKRYGVVAFAIKLV